jgi:Glycosyltransferase family 87
VREHSLDGVRPRWAERAELVLSWVGAAVALMLFLVWLPGQATRSDVRELDLYIYYETAVRLAHGQPIYTGRFLYPPTFAALVRPAAAMSLGVFQTTWSVIILGAFWAYATGLTRLAFGRLTLSRVLAVAAVVMLTPGTHANMDYGQINLAIWALVAWSLPAGVGLAVGACLKVYPGVVAAAAAVRYPSTAWRQLGVAAAFVTSSLAVLGTGPFVEWLHAGIVPLPDCTLLPGNLSLSTGILRILHVADFRGGFARAIYLAVPALVVGGTFWRTRRWPATSAGAAVLVATVWSSPVCWQITLPILLIPLAVWLRGRLGQREERAVAAAPAGL